MRFSILTAALACASFVSADITFTVLKSSNPSDDQRDAYARIYSAMEKASARYTRITDAQKHITVTYEPDTKTAEGSSSGKISFGADRTYMKERTALHEISHTLGVGQTNAFTVLCKAQDWLESLPLLREWNGPDAKIECTGGHFSPYGMNYDSEWSEDNGDKHCKIVQAMLDDGM
ncbi:hypothetical protein IMZ48_26450 [Candidatus Bathyarchaeota archaeon]|nr:hypothetical protein [Candidatus Bathyarchaeota archaeon]